MVSVFPREYSPSRMGDASGSNDGSRRRFERVDGLFEALADEHRRRVIQYFRTNDDVATVDALVDHASERDGSTRDRLEGRFHHVTLPKLADLGVLEYDARSRPSGTVDRRRRNGCSRSSRSGSNEAFPNAGPPRRRPVAEPR